jgi:arylsulfatase A-like enzyme
MSGRRRGRRTAVAALALLVVLAALAWHNRLVLLRHSLGWYTDLVHPRAPTRPVPWQAGPAAPDAPPGARPPNIVVILADDLGFNDVTTYGGGHADWNAATPNIDALAREGVRFDHGYAGSAVCTPSRAALMTGRYPWRFGVEFTPTPGAMARVASDLYAAPGRLRPVVIDHDAAAKAPRFDVLGMPGSERTIAEVLRERGYRTLHIGKWHLGSTREMRPNAQGFDETLFMESGLYLPVDDPRAVNSRQDFDPIDRFLWPNMRWAASHDGGAWFEPGGYLTDWYTDEAVAAIRANRHRPFFLYLAHWGVHTPLQATRADYDATPVHLDHRRRVYAAMIRALDRSVGRVMQALRDEGLDRDTLVVFTSDNGAPAYLGLPEVNRPFRGWKLTLFEGGLRVPFVARWPARLPPGQRIDAPVSGLDLLPVAAAAAGATLPADRPIDGIDWLPWLGDPATARPPARTLHFRDGAYRAVRDGHWKLIVSERPQRTWLFDLATDPTERTDVSGARPEQVARLRSLMDAHHAGMPPPRWRSFLEFPVSIDRTLDEPQRPDDEHTYWIN